ncbi:MAG: carboxypeptidase-like regulatory domain-containing protein [Alkalilacustris sp.]
MTARCDPPGLASRPAVRTRAAGAMTAGAMTAGRMSAAKIAAAMVAAGLAGATPPPALGHAALLDAEATTAVRLHARYDTGAPMAGAQVIIYAPDAPADAWSHGTTDAAGRYVFVPDMALPGRWTVQVRQAGHGAVAHVTLGADAGARDGDAAAAGAVSIRTDSPPASPLQRAVMIALVAWGALGTALYFRRRRDGHASA